MDGQDAQDGEGENHEGREGGLRKGGGKAGEFFCHRLHRFTQMGAAASWVESPEGAAALSTGLLREGHSIRFTNR